MKKIINIFLLVILFVSCQETTSKYDATGTFEATEIIVSAEAAGKVLSFSAEEGQELKAGAIVAKIDASNLELQKQQIEATISAVNQKQGDATPQVAVLQQQIKSADASLNTLQTQMEVLKKEQDRIQKMFTAEAATQKQLDDVNGQVDVLQNNITAAKTQKEVLRAQIQSTKDAVALQNTGISSEKAPLRKRAEQIEDLMNRATVTNPIDGTVLTKYANEGELIAAGRPLYKLANLSEMVLRAYVSGSQLGRIKTGQPVGVYIDDGEEKYKKYDGTITWISPKAEFTPKTIQTKEERANLVYATKIVVKNDGYLKIGMYGEVDFENTIAEKE